MKKRLQIANYTAGIEAVGGGHRIFVIQSALRTAPLANPLLHATDYYCLGTGNVNLDNYEASMPHFPIKYRRGITRGHGAWNGYPQQDVVDVVLIWQTSPGDFRGGFAGWEENFHREALRIYRRPPMR